MKDATPSQLAFMETELELYSLWDAHIVVFTSLVLDVHGHRCQHVENQLFSKVWFLGPCVAVMSKQ